MAFWQFTGSQAEFFPGLGLTARPGFVYDFGSIAPPIEPLPKEGGVYPLIASKWSASNGPANDGSISQISDATIRTVRRSGTVSALPLYAAGHSGLVDTSTQTTGKKYISQLGRLLGLGTVTNLGVTGYYMQDVAKVCIGSAGTPLAAPQTGLVLIDGVANDNLIGGQAQKNLDGMAAGLDAILWAATAASRTEETNAAFVYGGAGWTPLSNTRLSGGAVQQSSTAGNTVTITIPVGGGDFGLVVYGNDPASAAPGVYTVTLDGAAVVTSKSYSFKGGTLLTTGAVVIPFRGLSASTHTVVLTVGAGGGVCYVDCLIKRTTTPAQVVVIGETYCTQAGYTSAGGGASNASVDTYNALAKATIAANWSTSQVVFVDLNAAGFDPTLHVGTDGIHYNDAGCVFAVDAIADQMSSFPFRTGMNKT